MSAPESRASAAAGSRQAARKGTPEAHTSSALEATQRDSERRQKKAHGTPQPACMQRQEGRNKARPRWAAPHTTARQAPTDPQTTTRRGSQRCDTHGAAGRPAPASQGEEAAYGLQRGRGPTNNYQPPNRVTAGSRADGPKAPDPQRGDQAVRPPTSRASCPKLRNR